MSSEVRQYAIPRSAAEKLVLNIDNSIVAADPDTMPDAVGSYLMMVNDATVSNRSETREELQHLQEDQLVTLVVASSPSAQLGGGVVATSAEAGDIAVVSTNKSRDEFDLESDDDEQQEATFTPPPPQPPGAIASDVLPRRMNAEDVIVDVVSKTSPDSCILLLCDGYNPSVQVEGAATRKKVNVMHIDPVTRIKTRQRLEEYSLTLRKSLEKGVWIFIENSTKSISLLEQLADCIDAVRAAGTIHPATAILLMCEPHPHFPVRLLSGCVTLKLKPATISEEITAEDLSESRTRMTLLKCTPDSLPAAAAPLTSALSGGNPARKRRVKIAAEVDVVRIESSAFLEMSASAIPPTNDNCDGHDGASGDAGVGTGIARVARFRFGPSEKLISLCRVSDDRVAVGTSSGYIVVLDRNGLPLIQYRPHKACVWDVAFSSPYDFATASEDGTSSVYRYDLAEQELEAVSVASFQSDVFAVAYARDNDPTSAVLSGGLSATICILHSDRKTSSFVPASTSIQAMCSVPSRGHALIGGGNGAITLVDTAESRVVDTSNKHTRKVPAVAACGSTLLTGSFDKTLRVWDYRSAFHCSHNLVMSDVLTAAAISDSHIAACSGSSLYLWDLRNLHQVLAVKNKAWNGLTRGLVLDGKTMVTASVDGAARFWRFS